jgi:hypothetical protein
MTTWHNRRVSGVGGPPTPFSVHTAVEPPSEGDGISVHSSSIYPGTSEEEVDDGHCVITVLFQNHPLRHPEERELDF